MVGFVVVCWRSRYQLVWMTDAEVASNIVTSPVVSPFVFVLNPETHEFYLMDELTTHQLTIDDVVNFLDDVSNGSRQVFQLTLWLICSVLMIVIVIPRTIYIVLTIWG